MSNPTRYDFDNEEFEYDEENDEIRSRDGNQVFTGDGEPVS